jgi:hypothetical protein
MTQLTSIELGASGNFIRFDDAAFDNVGAQTWLILCRPTASPENNFGYLFAKTPTGSINGPRFFLDTATAGVNPGWTFGAHSTGTAARPLRNAAANSAVINRLQLVAATWSGGLAHTDIHIYTEVADAGGVLTGTMAEVTYFGDGAGNDGTTAIADDSANPQFLMNRFGLGRAFVGDWYAWQWDHVKDLTAINVFAAAIVAETGGPLDDTTGMLLGWANQADLGPGALTPASRSTFAAGTLPAYTELGGAAPGGHPAVKRLSGVPFAARQQAAAGARVW